MISGDDSQTGDIVEVRASGTIEVTEGASEEEEEEEEDEGGGELHNTGNEPYRRTLSVGDRITVNS